MLPNNRDALREAAAKQTFSYLFFWGHKGGGEKLSETCLSQWAPVGFTVEGVRYPTAEHWMMAQKTRLFNDPVRLAQILATPHPNAAKRLGRQVEGFVQEIWLANRRQIVVDGNLHKFSQNPAEGGWLMGTAGRVLVEASPMDTIWGIGYSQDRPEARDPHRWRGLNLLGFALMDVRAALISPS